MNGGDSQRYSGTQHGQSKREQYYFGKVLVTRQKLYDVAAFQKKKMRKTYSKSKHIVAVAVAGSQGNDGKYQL